jgi:hypothetical protein
MMPRQNIGSGISMPGFNIRVSGLRRPGQG